MRVFSWQMLFFPFQYTEEVATQDILGEVANTLLSDGEPTLPDILSSSSSIDGLDYTDSDSDTSLGFSPRTQTPNIPTMPTFPYEQFYEALNSPIIIPYEDTSLPSSEFRDSVPDGVLPFKEAPQRNPTVVEEYSFPAKQRSCGFQPTDINHSIQKICDCYSDIVPKTPGSIKEQRPNSHGKTREANFAGAPSESGSRSSTDNAADTISEMPPTQHSNDVTTPSSEDIYGCHPLGSLTPNQFWYLL